MGQIDAISSIIHMHPSRERASERVSTYLVDPAILRLLAVELERTSLPSGFVVLRDLNIRLAAVADQSNVTAYHQAFRFERGLVVIMDMDQSHRSEAHVMAILLLLARLAAQDQAVQASVRAQAQDRRRAACSTVSEQRGLPMNDNDRRKMTVGRDVFQMSRSNGCRRWRGYGWVR